MGNKIKDLSPHGILIDKLKKAALSFDKNVSSGIEYELMRVIEADIAKRAKFDLKINLIKGIRELQNQYKQLFNDYAKEAGLFSNDEYPFDNIIKNTESAYNKATALIDLLSKTIL